MSRKVWCDDWSCPAARSCVHHFGRSAAYAAMREGVKCHHGDGTPYDRHASEDRQSCASYRFDRQKEWLKPKLGQITHTGGFMGFRA